MTAPARVSRVPGRIRAQRAGARAYAPRSAFGPAPLTKLGRPRPPGLLGDPAARPLVSVRRGSCSRHCITCARGGNTPCAWRWRVCDTCHGSHPIRHPQPGRARPAPVSACARHTQGVPHPLDLGRHGGCLPSSRLEPAVGAAGSGPLITGAPPRAAVGPRLLCLRHQKPSVLVTVLMLTWRAAGFDMLDAHSDAGAGAGAGASPRPAAIPLLLAAVCPVLSMWPHPGGVLLGQPNPKDGCPTWPEDIPPMPWHYRIASTGRGSPVPS